MLYLGYACINNELRKDDIFTSRTLRLKSFEERGLEEVQQIALRNITDLKTIIEWNEQHGIKFYRVTSDLFPHIDNPLIAKFIENYTINFAKRDLEDIGFLAKKYNQRITMHPSQFVQLGTPHIEVLNKSISTLTQHANILTAMGLSVYNGSGLVIHGGGTYGNKTISLNNWKTNFTNLPDHVKEFIILENDEWNYSVDDLLPICEELDIPFCLDIFHNSISKDKVKITEKLIQRIFNTWKYFYPKMHYSEQEPDLRKGSHSKSVHSLPKWVFKLPYQFNTTIYLMLEVKDKEESVLRIYNKYFNKIPVNNIIEWKLKPEYYKLLQN